MGVKILIYILFSFSLLASNIECNITNSKTQQNSIKNINSNYLTNNQEEIRKIARDEFYKHINQTQLEHQNAIIKTNNNITLFGIVMGTILTLLGLFYYFNISKTFEKIKQERKEAIRELKDNLIEKITTEQKSIEENIKDTLEFQSSKKIKKIAMSEIELAMSKLFNLQKLSEDLHFLLNKTLVQNLNKESPSKAFAKYNQRFEKIINITSLQKEHIIPALKEIKVPIYRSILHSNEMKKYLEALKDYTDDIDIIEEVNKLLSIIRIHNQNNSKNRNDKSKTNNIKRKLNNEDKTKSISIFNRIKNVFNK